MAVFLDRYDIIMKQLITFINFISYPAVSFTLWSGFVFLLFPQTRGIEKIHRFFKLHYLWTKTGGFVLITSELLAIGLCSLHPHFREVALKPDNLPALILLVLISFFAWLAMFMARRNDKRLNQGLDVLEKDDQEKVLVWPDLVFIEFITALFISGILILWGLALPAPLEGIADPSHSPNPAKAPWYFLALQEMLVYFDPWYAGVLMPTVFILFLMSLPYVDSSPGFSGCYTFDSRRFAIGSFVGFFVGVWVYLIFVGTILRGPNWNFFGLFESWDSAKAVALTNVNLSEYIYVVWLGKPLPSNIFIREIGGIIFLLLYFVGLPIGLAKTLFSKLYKHLGRYKYYYFLTLYLLIVLLPVKMYLRWLFNLKYILAIPEFMFNL